MLIGAKVRLPRPTNFANGMSAQQETQISEELCEYCSLCLTYGRSERLITNSALSPMICGEYCTLICCQFSGARTPEKPVIDLPKSSVVAKAPLSADWTAAESSGILTPSTK